MRVVQPSSSVGQRDNKLLDFQQQWRERLVAELGDRPRSWLAAESGLDAATITRILNGDTVPTDAAKWRLAGALGRRVDELFSYPAIIPAKTWLDAQEAS